MAECLAISERIGGTEMTKTNVFLIVLVLALLIFSSGCGNKADSTDFIPKPVTGAYVIDNANVFDGETKEYIIDMGKELDSKHRVQLRVVSVYTTRDMSIEEYSTKLFREWNIGDKNNSVLILIARNDKESYIKASQGLEDCLTNSYCEEESRILVNHFRYTAYSASIRAVCRDIVQQICREYGDMEMYQNIQEQKEQENLHGILACVLLIGGFLSVLFSVLVCLILI